MGLVLSGCASTHSWYYHDNGVLCAEVRSTVLGTGETEMLSESTCATLGYSTRDTGLSDNGKEVVIQGLESLAKGAIKGVVPVP